MPIHNDVLSYTPGQLARTVINNDDFIHRQLNLGSINLISSLAKHAVPPGQHDWLLAV